MAMATVAAAAVFLMLDAAQAAQRVLAFKEVTGRDWARKLLNYDITFSAGEFRAGKLELLGPDGTAQPLQVVVLQSHADGSIKLARVSFYGELKAGGEASYTLRSAVSPALTAPQVQVKAAVGRLEITSVSAGVAIPTPCEKKFDPPADPASVPAPILAFRLSNGVWACKGALESERKIVSLSQKVVADGPLYKEYAYEVTYAPEGRYRVRIRVEAELPLVYVAEEYDMGCATSGRDFFVLALNEGWKADTALWACDRLPAGKQVQVRDRRIEHDTCVWREALDFSGDAKDREHSRIFPTGDWGGKAQWYGIFADREASSPFVGIMTMHTGAWRLPDQSLSSVCWTKSGKVLAKMRTSINLNGNPQNPFSTAESDLSLPQTLGRRVWALVLGPRPAPEMTVKGRDGKDVVEKKLDYRTLDLYRSYYGFINLDDYKDWILSWNDAKLPRPRVYSAPELLARLKANLDSCPGKAEIEKYYLINGDPKVGAAEAAQAKNALASRFTALGFFLTHYRQTQFDLEPAFLADSALSCKSLDPQVRADLRAQLAAMCYMLSHSDFCPRGAGTHMGNPNMAINRFMGLPLYATIIGDHPKAKAWLDEANVYTRWKAAHNTTSGGGTFRENPGYATYGPTVFLTMAAIALRNSGYDIDTWEPLKDIGRYFVDISTARTHPRGNTYRKALYQLIGQRRLRVLPGFGNGADVPGGQTQLMLASLTAKADPEFASQMMGSFQESGQILGSECCTPFFWLLWNPDIKPKTPVLRQRAVAGFGGVLRAHEGGMDETYVVLRNGYTQSHWNADQGTLVLYARGACVSPPTGWGYSGTAGICHDSRICFGQALADHEHGRVDSNIEDYGVTPSAGYLLGRQTFLKRWDPTKTTLKGNFDWSRQTVLIKSEKPDGATYVVVRDTTQGDCSLPSWYYQWLVCKAEDVQPLRSGVRAKLLDGVMCDVTFVEPANAKIAVKGTKVDGFAEEYCQFSLQQEPGKGYTAVYFPYKNGEPTPSKIEKLADGVVRVTTRESTDYVFMGVDKPVTFKDATVDIAAYAGAVRIFKDRVLLINTSGQYGKVACRGAVAEGFGPFEQAATSASPSVIKAGPEPAKVTEHAGKAFAVDGAAPEGCKDMKAQGIKGYVAIDGDKQTFVAGAGTGMLGYKDFYIKGEAPFVCTHRPGLVTITTEGRRRIFQMPIPMDVVPAKLLPPVDSLPEDFKLNWSVGGWINWPWAVDGVVDGVSREIGWYDGLMTVGVDDGRHRVEIGPWSNPPVWQENAYTRMLPVK